MVSQQDLQNMKTGEVAEQARKAGIEGVEEMNKQEMIDEWARAARTGLHPATAVARGIPHSRRGPTRRSGRTFRATSPEQRSAAHPG